MTKKEKYIEKIKYLRNKMFSKYCPVMKDKCTAECIHFDAGKVIEVDNIFGLMLIQPKCKLWAK